MSLVEMLYILNSAGLVNLEGCQNRTLIKCHFHTQANARILKVKLSTFKVPLMWLAEILSDLDRVGLLNLQGCQTET